jgi:hypothetical protein
MLRMLMLALVSLALAIGAPEVQAQSAPAPDWTPPSREMPMMPLMSELQADWQSALGAWFRGVEQVSGVPTARLRAGGEAGKGSQRAQLARFTSGPVPVAVWTDRNGDERADIIELYRGGGVVVQLIDADYDGKANVIRILDASGGLVRERPM